MMIGPPSKKMPHYAGVSETTGMGGGERGDSFLDINDRCSEKFCKITFLLGTGPMRL